MKSSIPQSSATHLAVHTHLQASSPSTTPVNADELFAASVTQRIAARAATDPESLALESAGRRYSFAELEGKANGLAQTLLSLGTGVGSIVGICLGRGPEMVIAALAAMKAGAAYLPVDPAYPLDRLRYMLADSGVQVLMTFDEMATRIRGESWQMLILDEDASDLPIGEPPAPRAFDEKDLAYIVYTSGSTGRPKGVQIPHSGLSNLISWHERNFKITPADRTSQIASISFDAAVWEIWPNLAAGASIHFADETQRVSPAPLREWLIAEKISVAFAPTPLAEALLRLDWPRNTSLRLLLTGGDTLHLHPPAGLPFAVVNNYGPTECTVVASSGEILPNSDTSVLPSIGRPIDNFSIYILDEDGRPVPQGEVGEIYIAGAGVARGYLNQPSLDLEKFVPDPFNAVPARPMYRTGDLGRYLETGEIGFAGRVDDQIKIRGFRIEPDEIAATLNQHPEIESSIVLARDHSSLIAYVAAHPAAVLTEQKLQAHLRSTLPEYMIPSVFVRVGRLPLTDTGKIDRSALPEPSPENMVADQTRVRPQTIVEARVVEILSELLGITTVGVQDNFFFLGGHSLLGTQLISRVRDSFGVELPLRSVFDLPTAEQLSGEIERLLRGSALPEPTNAE